MDDRPSGEDIGHRPPDMPAGGTVGAACHGRQGKLVLPSTLMHGRFISLEPLSEALRSAVSEAFAIDEDAWRMLVHSGAHDAFDQWWARTNKAIAEGRSIIYAVRRQSDGCIVGTSGYLSFDADHFRVEIGSTYLRPDARASAVNPESKLLLLEAAFAAGAHRVEFLTDARNRRSRAALKKLEAVEEGILRRHKVTWTGTVRDSAIFSITDLDWPAASMRLTERLSGFDPR